MGNQPSSNINENNKEQDQTQNKQLKPTSVSHIMDYIASHYILTMDFQSLKKMSEQQYCDKLVILTTDIIERYFSDMEINYLAQRMKNGEVVNEQEKENIIFFNKADNEKIDMNNSIKKKRICQSISKFYIKIGHIFAAIITTINPIYIYKDPYSQQIIKVPLSEKNKIPENVERNITKLGFCKSKVKSLDLNAYSSAANKQGIQPNLCDFYSSETDKSKSKSLIDEPGIKELEELYYDDDFNIETGQFNGMSPMNKKLYEEDLKIFYQVFTGKTEIPDYIKKFSDIKLRNFEKDEKCSAYKSLYKKVDREMQTEPQKNKLFIEYANNIKKMILQVQNNQEELLKVINQLFVYVIDPQTNKKKVRIHPKLTETDLAKIVVETRAIIIKLYLSCEVDYVNGLKIYEAIVDQKILETAKNQIKHLEDKKDQYLLESKIPKSSESILLQK
jgi:hypothetical protein